MRENLLSETSCPKYFNIMQFEKLARYYINWEMWEISLFPLKNSLIRYFKRQSNDQIIEM